MDSRGLNITGLLLNLIVSLEIKKKLKWNKVINLKHFSKRIVKYAFEFFSLKEVILTIFWLNHMTLNKPFLLECCAFISCK